MRAKPNRFTRWTLADGVELNREYPDTFWVPSAEEIDQLRVGDLVKLVFEARNFVRPRGDYSGERMWVLITAIDGENFEGELDNDPIVWKMKAGDLIRFRREHIIDYICEDDE